MPSTKSAISIAFDETGAGDPALLCLPGWCAEKSAFKDLLDSCGHSRRVLALDWRGHGQSASTTQEFGLKELADDAEAVILESDAKKVVPVALAHSGWVAIELRRRLGEKIPAIILVDWLVLDPPPQFVGALDAMQDTAQWEGTRNKLFEMWLKDIDNQKVNHLVRNVMGAYTAEMWSRAGREIGNAYRQAGNPLKALSTLTPSVPVLHLYAQPDDPMFLESQLKFARENPWYHVHKLDARSHFPMLEVAEEMAASIESFLDTQNL